MKLSSSFECPKYVQFGRVPTRIYSDSPVNSSSIPGSFPVLVDFFRLPFRQVFLTVLPATSLETVSDLETISSAFQNVFF